MNRRPPLPFLLATLALMACLVAPAIATAQNACAGGGRPRPDEGGIGGTGQPRGASAGHRPPDPEEDESGVGGTGIVADGDTGIIGTITGFASICVGDLEVHYDEASSVEIDGRAASTSDLAVGQVVEIVASGSGDALRARQIAVRSIVAGPVTRVDAERGEIDVIGQTVRLAAEATGEAGALAPGTFVRVGGLRRTDGVIAASIVTRADSTEVSRLTGPVGRVAPGTVDVAGTTVGFESGGTYSLGDEVRVAGRWDGTRLVAASIKTLPRVPFDGRVARVEIEGYARRESGERLRVGSFLLDLPAGGAIGGDIAPDTPVRIHAQVRDRRVIVEGLGVRERPSLPERHDGGAERRPDGAERAPERRHGGAMPDRPHHDLPERPDRPERMDGLPMPERPPPLERAPLPERPQMPQRPERPPRPEFHQRSRF